MSDDVVLSICVPTFNRVDMLKRNIGFHRAAFRALGLRFEIVVVDDCSTDGTADYLASLPDSEELRVFRRARNSGFLDNYAYAMRRARGRYAVFLGDDDLLIPDQVMTCLGRLESDASLGMVQAPWMCVDERPGQGPIGPFYHLPAERRFAHNGHAALIRFVFDHHVFPEFMIIRRSVLAKSISSPCPFIFWAFLYTGRALAHGDVLFVPTPFARVTAVSADPRQQQGNKETMFQWDHYRGGVEYLVSLARSGMVPTAAAVDDVLRFMLVRQKVALRLHLNAGNWAEAYVLYHRITAYEPPPVAAADYRQLCQLAGITTAVKEAVGFGSRSVAVDPMVTDAMLSLVRADLRERLVREPAAGGAEGEAPRAFLRLDPAFPGALGSSDAVFDLQDYIAQFV